MNVYDYYLTPEDYKIAAANGIDEKLLYTRVYMRNWSVQRATSTPPCKRNAWGWVERKEIAIKNGVSYPTYAARVKSGWDRDKAATTPPLRQKDKVRLMNESKKVVLTTNQIEEAKRNGIPYSVAWKRIKLLNWTIFDAITTPVLTRVETLERAKQTDNAFRTQNNKYLASIRSKHKWVN